MLPLLPAIFLSKVRYRKGRAVLWPHSPFALSDPLPTRLRHDLFECLLHFPRRLRYPSTCFLPAVHCHPPSCHLPAQSGYLPARRCLPALSECLPVRCCLPALSGYLPARCCLPAPSGFLPARRCLPAPSGFLPALRCLPALAGYFLLSLAPAQIRHNLTAELP